MTKALAGYGRLLAAALTGVAVLLLGASPAAGQEATVRMEAPSTEIVANGSPFTVSVVVQDVTNLGAFEFDLTYDSAILTSAGIEEGVFLGSSGRQVQCLPSRTQAGLVGLTCVTLGATPDGPNGSGVLASITFQPIAPGSSTLHLTRLTLTDPPAQPIAAQAKDATITVSGPPGSGGGGFAWALWGPVIGVGALALGAAAVWTAWRVCRRRSA